jgi:hypothetical protein
MRALLPLVAVVAACAPALPVPVDAAAAAVVGQPAPDFTLNDLDGAPFKLSDKRGSTVVLEWFNPDCPFVKYAYDQGPLGSFAGRWIGEGVVVAAINSGKAGKQGAGVERNRAAKAAWGMPASVLLDEAGEVGRTYGAKTTPQIVVINPAGTLVYNGALDNAPLGKVSGDAHRVFADEVLTQVTQDGTAPYGHQKPYGCSVKY